jgi:hypothetical protein
MIGSSIVSRNEKNEPYRGGCNKNESSGSYSSEHMTERISKNSTLSPPSSFVGTLKPSSQATEFSQISYQHYAQNYKSMQYIKRPLTR